MSGLQSRRKHLGKRKNGDASLIAARISVALLLVVTLAVGGACSALRSGTEKALHQQSTELSGDYNTRQDATHSQHPDCCAGCARAVALPAAILSCPQEEFAFEPVKADPNAVITVSEVLLSGFSDGNPQPFHHVPPVRLRPYIINCVLLC